jgi:ribosome-binding protein aMBF1 (putative translation factor)
MIPWQQVLAKQLRDPKFRAEWERLAPAREIAHRLIAYRVQHGLTQSALARRLCLSVSTVADLEDAKELPTAETLATVETILANVLEAD